MFWISVSSLTVDVLYATNTTEQACLTLINLLHTVDELGVWLHFAQLRFLIIMTSSCDSYLSPPWWSFGCRGCIGGGGLARVAGMCERTGLGEVVAAGVL